MRLSIAICLVGILAVVNGYAHHGTGISYDLTHTPITIKGTPAPVPADSLRLVDLLGTGTSGVLYSREADQAGRPADVTVDGVCRVE